MKVNVKTKKVQEVEIIEKREIDLVRLVSVFKSRYKADVDSGSDMISIPKEAVEDAIAVLRDCVEKEEMMKDFEERVPEDMIKELKAMATVLALTGM